MEKHSFKGKWITTKEFSELNKINVFHRYLEHPLIQDSRFRNSHILFRKKFSLGHFDRAFIYISADDYYKLYINGRFVTSGPAPSYYENYNYNAVNVGSYLKEGENTIAVHTYYQGLINRVWVSGDNLHGLILDLDCDGKTVVKSDSTFLCKPHSGYEALGVCGYDTQFTERYDACAPEVGFEKSDFDDSFWQKARTNPNIDYSLTEQKTKMLVFEKIKPQIMTKTEYGYFIDFGKNYCGYLNFTALGNRYDKIRILSGQEKDKNNRVIYKMKANCAYEDEMILSGGNDAFNPFDYKALRFAELILPKSCTIDENSVFLTARHYPFELKASFLSADENIEKIKDLCLHTLKYGTQETVMDCPDREKGFYLGDGCYTALTLCVLTNDRSLFRKAVGDALSSATISPSLLTCLDCSLIQEIAEFPLIMINCAAEYLKITNDKKYIDSIKDKLKAVLDYYKNNYTDGDGLIARCDKWCVAEWPEKFRDNYDVKLRQNEYTESTHCVINAYYYAAMASMNSILGFECYDTEKQKELFLNNFYNKKTGLFKDSTVSKHSSLISNMFSFAFGLCPDSENEEKMVALLNEKGINSLNIFTVFPVLQKLKDENRHENLLKQLENPKAWLNMLSQGATTTFEVWGKEQKWNTSLFHITLSYAIYFLIDRS